MLIFLAGMLSYARGKYEEADNIFLDILPQFQSVPYLNPLLADVYLVTGKNTYTMGRFQQAQEWIEKASEQLKSHTEPSPYLLVESYRLLGATRWAQGDIDQAETYKRESLRLAKEQLHPAHPALAGALRSWGVFYEDQNKGETAIPHFKQALAIYQQAGDYLSEALMLNNLGNAVNNTGKRVNGVKEGVHEAIKYFEKCIYVWEHKQDKFNPERGTPHFNLSIENSKLKRYDKSLYNLQKALEIELAAFGKHNPRVAEDYRWISDMYSRMGRYAEAFEAAQLSLQTIDPEFHGTDRYENPKRVDVKLYQQLYYALRWKAGLLKKYYKEHSQDPKDLEMALKTYQQMGDLLDYTRTRFDSEKSKIYLQERARNIAANGIKTACTLYELTQDSTYLYQAFTLSEKSKAVLLAEAFSEKEIRKLSQIPDEAWEEEKALKRDLSEAEAAYWEEQKKNGHADSTLLSQLQKERFRLKTAYRELVQSLRNQYPEYYDLQYNVSVSSVPEIQQHLDDSTALLSYFVGYNTTYVFTITQEDLRMDCISNTQSEKDSLELFASMISQGAKAYLDHEDLAHKLYEKLIKNPLGEPKRYPNLVLIPDGHLGYIPFELLLTEKRSVSSTYRDLAYVIRQHTCSYAYSATLMLKNQGVEPGYVDSYVGFAPTYSHDLLASAEALDNFEKFRSSPVELEGIYDEVNFAQSLFGGKAYLKHEATEQQFKQLERTPAILHLAMHALVDDQNPLHSKLLFTSENDGVEDGFLNAYEIYNMQIPSQLAILSACNTGFGTMKRGEGIMSLSRAFMYAGCPSVVMSLWRAKDQPTGKIMNAFFQHLKDGKAKDDALRRAKLEYLSQADPLQAHPANWATFVVVGDPDPLTFDTGSSWTRWWVIMAVLVALAAGIWFFRRKSWATH